MSGSDFCHKHENGKSNKNEFSENLFEFDKILTHRTHITKINSPGRKKLPTCHSVDLIGSQTTGLKVKLIEKPATTQ